MGTVLAFVVAPTLVFLLLAIFPPVQSYPDGGRTICSDVRSSNTSAHCSAAQTLLKGGQIFLRVDFDGTLNADILLRVSMSMSNCESWTSMTCIWRPNTAIVDGNFKSPLIVKVCEKEHEEAVTSGTSTNATSTSSQIWESVNTNALFPVEEDGIYTISVDITGEQTDLSHLQLISISITLKNPYGYLDAADYPTMLFYTVLLVVYVFLAVVWCILLCCYYKDLVRLQFFIAVVVLVTVLEAACFLAEYAGVNNEGVPSKGYFSTFLVATEALSALRMSFAKVLFLIVFSRHGPQFLLLKATLFGIAYFITAIISGLVRTFLVTRDGLPAPALVAFLPQLVMDIIFIVCIVIAIIQTRRTLKLQQNKKALTHYYYLVYTFLFCVFVVTALCVWFFISGAIGRCEDVKSLWLKECSWYIIFTVLLVAIMVLWRPSASARHYLYTPIHCDDEDDVGQNDTRHELAPLKTDNKNEVPPPEEGERVVTVVPPEEGEGVVTVVPPEWGERVVTVVPPEEGEGVATVVPPEWGEGVVTVVPPEEGEGVVTVVPPEEGEGVVTVVPPEEGEGVATVVPPEGGEGVEVAPHEPSHEMEEKQKCIAGSPLITTTNQ